MLRARQMRIGRRAMVPHAGQARSRMRSPGVMRQAQRNKQASVVNRSPYALLGMHLLRKRRRRR